MKTTKQNPAWWQLYLTFPLLIALFLVDNRLKISSRGHQVVQIGIIMFVYWIIHKWLKVNERALSHTDRQEHSPTFRVIHIPVYSSPEKGKQSLIQLPDSEIKGVLSDTFDMAYIDGEALPVEEVSN